MKKFSINEEKLENRRKLFCVISSEIFWDKHTRNLKKNKQEKSLRKDEIVEIKKVVDDELCLSRKRQIKFEWK